MFFIAVIHDKNSHKIYLLHQSRRATERCAPHNSIVTTALVNEHINTYTQTHVHVQCTHTHKHTHTNITMTRAHCINTRAFNPCYPVYDINVFDYFEYLTLFTTWISQAEQYQTFRLHWSMIWFLFLLVKYVTFCFFGQQYAFKICFVV